MGRNVSGAGTFDGGPGNDTVTGVLWEGAEFDGGPGNDTVGNDVFGGTFQGGEGDDTVIGAVYGSWAPGLFVGDAGDDTAGTVRSDPTWRHSTGAPATTRSVVTSWVAPSSEGRTTIG